MSTSRRRCLLFTFLLLGTLQVFADTTHAAAAALNQGRADDALHLLQSQISANPQDALSHQLLCRVFYSQEIADTAIKECEAAIANAPSNSDNYMWLGRAYGLKASRANPISAFSLARKVVAAFEHAVALDPANVPALSDLGEFYVAAPSLVGGGLDKAQSLAQRMMPVSATKAHRLLALIAEKKDDKVTAEAEFKKAVEAQRSPSAYVDLADFYQRRHQYDQSFAAIQSAIHIDHAKDATIVDAASILTADNHSPQLAEQLLTAYLASPAKSDSAPAAKVHVQLGDLLRKNGDIAGASREYQAALGLASNYYPARKALQELSVPRNQ